GGGVAVDCGGANCGLIKLGLGLGFGIGVEEDGGSGFEMVLKKMALDYLPICMARQ
ncbi:hypothetical protein Tco_0350412, partial [Tanacetum coccineum]